MWNANFIDATHILLMFIINGFIKTCFGVLPAPHTSIQDHHKCINIHDPQLADAYSVISCQSCWPCPPSLDRNNCYSAGDKTISGIMQINYILNIICFQCDGCIQGSAVK